MHFRYTKFDEELARLLRQFAGLTALFQHLLMRLNGDVDEVIRLMKQLQQKGYIDPKIDLDGFFEKLEEGNMIGREGESYQLTPKGEIMIRRDALNQVFTSLRKGVFGQHRTPYSGEGGERLPETRPYRFGDPLESIAANETINNAVKRSGPDDLTLEEQDFEVAEVEHTTSCATVLMLDISHSMVLYGEDRITPAKRVALALVELIRTRFPKDDLHVIVFGDDASEIRVEDLLYVGAGPYHTNTRAGLQLAQNILAKKKQPNKQIFMITDGKASAMYDEGGLYKNPFGLDPKIVNRTLEEAIRCRRNHVVITTFMLTDDPYLVDFVNKLTQVNRGRAYFTSLDRIGETIFVDYIRNRKRKL